MFWAHEIIQDLISGRVSGGYTTWQQIQHYPTKSSSTVYWCVVSELKAKRNVLLINDIRLYVALVVPYPQKCVSELEWGTYINCRYAYYHNAILGYDVIPLCSKIQCWYYLKHFMDLPYPPLSVTCRHFNVDCENLISDVIMHNQI